MGGLKVKSFVLVLIIYFTCSDPNYWYYIR